MPTWPTLLPLFPSPFPFPSPHLLGVKIIEIGAAIMWLRRHVRDHVDNVGRGWTIGRLLGRGFAWPTASPPSAPPPGCGLSLSLTPLSCALSTCHASSAACSLILLAVVPFRYLPDIQIVSGVCGGGRDADVAVLRLKLKKAKYL